MENQVELVEVDLNFERVKSLSRHLDVELVLKVLGYFRVCNSAHVVHGFQKRDLSSVLSVKVVLSGLKKRKGFALKLLAQHHIEEETHKNRKQNSP